MANPTSGFQLSALPQPLSMPSNLGKFDVGQTQQAYANALKNTQQTALLGPQTQAAVANAAYQKGLAEQQSRLLDPEEQAAVQKLRNERAEAALKARQTSALSALAPGTVGSAEQIARAQAAAQGVTAQEMAEKGYRILDPGNGMKFIQTGQGITSAYPAGVLSHGLGDTQFEYIGEAPDDPNTGQKKVKVRPFTLNAAGQQIPGPITEVVAGSVSYRQPIAQSAISVPATTPPSVATPRLPQPLGSFTAPAMQTIPQGGLINQVKTETGLPLAATEPSVPQTQVTPAAKSGTPIVSAPEPLIKPIDEVPHTQGLFGYQNKDNQVIWAPGKDTNDSIKNAIAKGIPAVVENPNHGLSSAKSINANDLKIREKSREEMQGNSTRIASLERSYDSLGRQLKIGDDVKTFAKIPLIGGIVNDFRKLFQPEVIALDNLGKQIAATQAKDLVGGRVAVQEMQNTISMYGDSNTPPQVRKELAMGYIIFNRNQIDYLQAKQKYYDAYKITNGFDSKWEQYSEDNPIGRGTPGVEYSVNENRIPWNLYNILKNKGYTNPNQTVIDHPELLNEKGDFDYNKLDNTGNAPWTSAAPTVKGAIVNPQNPVSNPNTDKTSNAVTNSNAPGSSVNNPLKLNAETEENVIKLPSGTHFIWKGKVLTKQ
jgi:hypothetical protein